MMHMTSCLQCLQCRQPLAESSECLLEVHSGHAFQVINFHVHHFLISGGESIGLFPLVQCATCTLHIAPLLDSLFKVGWTLESGEEPILRSRCINQGSNMALNMFLALHSDDRAYGSQKRNSKPIQTMVWGCGFIFHLLQQDKFQAGLKLRLPLQAWTH